MIRIIEGMEAPGCDPMWDAMFADRKRVFVDLRNWDVPVLAGRFEIDQFDGPRSIYCIATDAHGAHRGSIRLLPTDAPHILGTLFPELCDGPVPCGPALYELTRACVSPDLPACDRRVVRNMLTSAVVDYALYRGIAGFTCIADSTWLAQIPRLGWRVRALGAPRRIGRAMTGALQIEIERETPDLLKAAGIHMACRLVHLDDRPAIQACGAPA